MKRDEADSMTGVVWLETFQGEVLLARAGTIEASVSDEATRIFLVRRRSVVVHVHEGVGYLMPSVSAGTLHASHVDRVQHGDPTSFAVSKSTITAAVQLVVSHLSSDDLARRLTLRVVPR